jgi:tetratricopeptide (TPR) repeat protein
LTKSASCYKVEADGKLKKFFDKPKILKKGGKMEAGRRHYKKNSQKKSHTRIVSLCKEANKIKVSDPKSALRLLREALKISPGNRFVLGIQVQCYYTLRQNKKAVEVAERLIKLDKGEMSHYLLAESYRKANRYQDALNVVAVMPVNSWRGYLTGAYCYMHINEPELSFASFEKARLFIEEDDSKYEFDSRIRIYAGYIFLWETDTKGVVGINLLERVKESASFFKEIDINKISIFQKRDFENALNIYEKNKEKII